MSVRAAGDDLLAPRAKAVIIFPCLPGIGLG